MVIITEQALDAAMNAAEKATLHDIDLVESQCEMLQRTDDPLNAYEHEKLLRGLEIARDALRIHVKHRLIAAAEQNQ